MDQAKVSSVNAGTVPSAGLGRGPEVEVRGGSVTYSWNNPIQFIAEDGGICHQLVNAALTLTRLDDPQPVCIANFSANRHEGGRKGSFHLSINILNSSGGVIMGIPFGIVEMPCQNSSALLLSAVAIPPEFYSLVHGAQFPATQEFGVEPC